MAERTAIRLAGGPARSFIEANWPGETTSHPGCRMPGLCGMRENSNRALAALLDELGRGSEEIVPLYKQGDGLCLGHLRQGLDAVGDDFPAGVES